MIAEKTPPLFSDHADARMVSANGRESLDRNSIVELDPEHPGFRDRGYRERRNQIARIAMQYQPGTEIPKAPYSAAEHDVWRTIWENLQPAQQEHACLEYLECARVLNFNTSQIPQLDEVSRKVQAISGFRLEPVAGLVEPRVFLESLANGVFLCTQYIRHHSTPLYTPEPDVAHEIIGHAVTLASPRLAELNQLFGEAVRRSCRPEALDQLSRVYWFTIEFGVLRERESVRAYGTGLLSSAGELRAMHQARLVPLDLQAAMHEAYDPTRFQAKLFCAESFDGMYEVLRGFLKRWIAIQ